MNDRLADRIRVRMRALDESGLVRTLRAPAGVDLSSNDYLGLASHPDVVSRMAAAVAVEGAGSTGSRLLRGHRDAFTAIESRFAAFKGTERSLYFSSGYLANIAVLATLPESGDLILSDERNHASLIDGIRLSHARREVFSHNDVEGVRRVLADRPETGERFLVVESLFSMDGDEAPLEAYADVCRTTGAHLIVDEAHAVGIYGQRGSGLIEARSVQDAVLLSVNTAGKALGASGAFVAGPSWAIDYLIQRARPFVFSTAPPPAIASALEASLDLIEREPWRREMLRERSADMRHQLRLAGLPIADGESHILPVMVGDNARAVAIADALAVAGFDVRAIRPPTVPAGTARLRVSVNVAVTPERVRAFVAALDEAVASATKGPCFAGSS